MKLQYRLSEINDAGAEVLAISIDRPDDAKRMALELGLTFPLLSDPAMHVIRAYGMKGAGMEMADMGYAVIDRQGRIRAKTIDRRFGDNVNDVIEILEKLKREA